MSFFLLAVDPPAIIDPIPSRPHDESGSAEERSPASIPLTVTPPPSESESPVASIPLEVIHPIESAEVRPVIPASGTPLEPLPYRESKKSPSPPLPPLPSTREGAEALGNPLSIQSPTVRAKIQGETQIVSGLNAKALASKGKFATVIARKKGARTTREFRISLDNSLARAIDPAGEKALELVSDEQEFDENTRVITARGNVTLRFEDSVLTSDRLQINLPEKLAVAEGKVILTRGDQILRGDRFEYFFVQDSGVVYNANGEIFQPNAGRDFGQTLPNDAGAGTSAFNILNDRLTLNQPLQQVTTAEGFTFAVGGGQNPGRREGQTGGASASRGTVNRLRFQAERLEFDGKVWNASNVRLTNDPFSPPELEVQADRATFRSTGAFTDELALSNSRVVFDQRVTAPTFISSLVFDRRRRRPNSIGFGYDGEDRGGFFIESPQTIVDGPNFLFELTPQYLIQKVLNPDAFPGANPGGGDVSPISPKAFGLLGNIEAGFGPRTLFQARASFSSLDLEQLEESARSKIRVQQKIGILENPYLLNAEYNYRERLFNGSLGFQTVNQSIGAILTSPVYVLGSSLVNLSFQTSIQNVDAPTDRGNLIAPNATDNVVDLGRFQGAVTLNRTFPLWAGATLPPTPEAGLRFSPFPVQPYIALFAGLTGVSSYYTSGDTQNSLTATVGFLGQFGNFSRSYLDYTGFNISFSQGLRDGESPFFFDRFVDQQIVSFGIVQQIYGPIRIGIQTSYSLDQSKEISTDYILEWSRRTYSVLLRYNPVLQIGTLNIRVSDFNWTGNPGYFEGTDIRPVVDGVTR